MNKHKNSIIKKFPRTSFSNFLSSLVAYPRLHKWVAKTEKEQVELRELLQRWKEAGQPDLGAWPKNWECWMKFWSH